MRFCELCEIFETIFFHHWESASGDRKTGSYLDGMIPFMIPFLLILLMNWLRKCMGNCRLYLEMFWQVACISGNKRANKIYIRIYSVNRNTLSVKSEKWKVTKRLIYEMFQLLEVKFFKCDFWKRKNAPSEWRRYLFSQKSSIIDVWKCHRFASETHNDLVLK